jgi:hypothetical protein
LVDCTQLGPNRVLECLFRTVCHIRFHDSGLYRLWISRNKRGGILHERNQPISLPISKQAPIPDYKRNLSLETTRREHGWHGRYFARTRFTVSSMNFFAG